MQRVGIGSLSQAWSWRQHRVAVAAARLCGASKAAETQALDSQPRHVVPIHPHLRRRKWYI